MEFDSSACQVITPTGDRLVALYRLLMDVFPADRPVLEAVIEQRERLYTWTPYTLEKGGELLGNVSLVSLRIWLGDRTEDLVGIASVATVPGCRRQGIARFLLGHCLNLVDRRGLPAVLFTHLPRVYQGVGFGVARQTYRGVQAPLVDFLPAEFTLELVHRLEESRLDEMARLYEGEYPPYDGKVVRDAAYWRFYRLLVDPFSASSILFCRRDGRIVGFARLEAERDRLLVSELCCPGDAASTAEAMLGFAARTAARSGLDWMTLALPEQHFAWTILLSHGIPLLAEPTGSHRETFMVRPAAGQPLGALGRLQWSLADKF